MRIRTTIESVLTARLSALPPLWTYGRPIEQRWTLDAGSLHDALGTPRRDGARL